MKKILKNIINIMCLLLFIVIAFSFVETIFFKNEYPLGYKTAIILSGSMEPTLSVDDLVIVKKAEEIEPGDIVAYYDENGNKVMHRVIDVEEDTITTKGDANNTADIPISKDKVCGKYVGKIKYLGKIVKFIKTPLGISVCFVLIIIILLIPEKCESKHTKEESKLSKTKIIVAIIAYAILLILGIVAGFYSKYRTTSGGEAIGVVAKFSAGINKTQEINLFKTANINNEVAEGKIIPGMAGNVDVTIYNDSEVLTQYEILVNEIENKYNIPIKYSLDGTNYYTAEEFSSQQINKGNLKYLDEKIFKLYWKWDLNENTNIDANIALQSEEVRIITQISVNFTQID